MKTFIVTWNKKEKYSEPLTRFTEIRTCDAKSALQICMKENGSLKRITVESIQEIDPITKAPIGEPIREM